MSKGEMQDLFTGSYLETKGLLMHFISSTSNVSTDIFLNRYIFKKIGDWHYAEELTNDTFLKAKEHLETLEEPEKVLNWMFRIASQLIAGWDRKNKNKKRLLLEFYDNVEVTAANANWITEEQTPYEERYEKLREAIGQLPELEQKIFRLQLQEKSYEEIAEICDVTVSIVANRLSRAKQKLRAWAAAWEEANAEGLDLDFSEFNRKSEK